MARPSLLGPLQERDFARLWLGQMVSDAGDWVNYVALTALVWNLTGSAWMVAMLRAAHAVPLLLLGPFSGVFVDRWNRKITLVVVDILRAGLVLLFPLAPDVWTILLITLVFNVVATFFQPAKNALIPQIVSPQRLLEANSLSSTTRNMAMVIGPSLGGIILAIGGTAPAFYVNSLTFAFSAMAIASMAVPGGSGRDAAGETSATQELVEGFRFASTNIAVRSALILEMGLAAGWGCINVLTIVIAEAVLGGGPSEFGLLVTSVGLGALVGAALTGFAGRQLGLSRLIPLGFLLIGSAIAGLANSHVLLAACFAYFVAGAGRTSIEISTTTLYQKSVPDELRGRIFSLRHMITHIVILGSNQFAGFFTDAASVTAILIGAAAIELACMVASFLLLPRIKQHTPL